MSQFNSIVLSLQAKDFLLASSIQDGCCWETSAGDDDEDAGGSGVTVCATTEEHINFKKLKHVQTLQTESQSSALPSVLLGAALFESSSGVLFLPLSCKEQIFDLLLFLTLDASYWLLYYIILYETLQRNDVI